MKTATELKPVLKYPGSKARIADWIVSHLPPHGVYCEPFFGGGAVLFAKPRCTIEVVNDLDDEVVSFFRCLREQPESLARLMELTPWARAEYETARTATEDPLERARRLLVRGWQGCGALTDGSYGWWVRRGYSGGIEPPSWLWLDVPERIKAVAGRLIGVQIECLPALTLIERHRNSETLLYCDPPYVASSRQRVSYRFEMTMDDHANLLDALNAHPGPAVVSGYDNPLYAERLNGWRRSQRASRTFAGSPSIEVLWLNPMAVNGTSQQRLELV